MKDEKETLIFKGPRFDETIKNWHVEICPDVYFGCPRRPNMWVRFWQFILLGWTWTLR
jgi:hypothetical protein